jgi:hypothetical protein
MKHFIFPILLFIHYTSSAQQIQFDLPGKIDPAGYFLFYLHGGLVTVKGDNAINDPVPEYGPYQYSRILDTLRAHGFNVISERRFPDVDDSIYANKITKQIHTLIRANVPLRNIILIGASAGSNIVLLVSDKLRNPKMNYVIMGGCSPDIYRYYLDKNITGNFLSVIESSDSHGTCSKIFDNRTHVEFHEITLETGLNHGFIYKPFAAWVDPVLQRFQIFAKGYKARKPILIDGH